MTTDIKKLPNRTLDGFVRYASGPLENGLTTTTAVFSQKSTSDDEYDVVIVGAGFAGLIAARELSHRNYRVLIIEARDRIGGRTFTTQVDNHNFEIGGTWIHWSQPHVWTEVTRYGLSITESKGVAANHISMLFDEGSRRKVAPLADVWSAMSDAMNKYSDVDGVQGRTVIPLPHAPLTALEAIRIYDQLSMKDRLDQISDLFAGNEEMREIFEAFLSMNMQGDITKGGFVDHLRWWALGDYELSRMFDKLGRYKIKEGTSALAEAMLNDCQGVKVLLFTPISSVDRTSGNSVTIRTQTEQVFTARAAVITVPLNALKNVEFRPALNHQKQRAVVEGQCRGGTKFWAKLEHPVGNWFGLAPYPNPITMAYTDDQEGTVIVGFGPDEALDIRDIGIVQREINKFLPDVQVKYVLGHDWRNDPFVGGTWSWYRPGQMSSSLLALQTPEPPVFFASGDLASGWRGFIDGALESGLTNVRLIEQYFANQST